MIVLHHGGPNGASLRLFIMLEELKLDYVTDALDLMLTEHWAHPHNARAEGGAVPVLVDDDLILTDGGIALFYVAEAYMESALLPADAAGRYGVRASIDTLEAALLDSIDLIGWHGTTSAEERCHYFQRLAEIPERVTPAGWSAVWSDAEADLVARARDKARDGLSAIEAALVTQPWLSGNAYGAADISAFALARTAPDLLPEEIASRPRLRGWLATVGARPAVVRALARAGDGLAYAPPR